MLKYLQKMLILGVIVLATMGVVQANTLACPECDITVTPPDINNFFCGGESQEFPFVVHNNTPQTQNFSFSLEELTDSDLADVTIVASTCGGGFNDISGTGTLGPVGSPTDSCIITVKIRPTTNLDCTEGCIDWILKIRPFNLMLKEIIEPIAPCFIAPPPPLPDCEEDPENPDCPQPPVGCVDSTPENLLGIASTYAVLSGGNISNTDGGHGHDADFVTKYCNGNAGAVDFNALNDDSPDGNTGGTYESTNLSFECDPAGVLDNDNAEDGAFCVCGVIDSIVKAAANFGCQQLGDPGDPHYLGRGAGPHNYPSFTHGGYYCFNQQSTKLTGELVLAAPGPYYFIMEHDFHVQTGNNNNPTKVTLTGGLTDDEIFWVVRGQTMDENPDTANQRIEKFVGNVLAVNDLDIQNQSGINTGRALSCLGDISLHNSYVVKP